VCEVMLGWLLVAALSGTFLVRPPFAPSGLAVRVRGLSHGLRRGLHSIAASRLHAVAASRLRAVYASRLRPVGARAWIGCCSRRRLFVSEIRWIFWEGCDGCHRFSQLPRRQSGLPFDRRLILVSSAAWQPRNGRRNAAPQPAQSCRKRKPWVKTGQERKSRRDERKHLPHTSSNVLLHLIFSTLRRRPLIKPEFRDDLFAYLGGIVREMRGVALAINGTADHVHMLVRIRPAHSSAEIARVVKANSSRWVRGKWCPEFAWQTGYGVFSVSESNVRAVTKYIAAQEKHHKKHSFQEEFLAFLKKNNVEYDERYLWD
jgi:putative transposase